jgi:hypothetical protein
MTLSIYEVERKYIMVGVNLSAHEQVRLSKKGCLSMCSPGRDGG